MSDTPEPIVTERGFQHHHPVPSEYGGHVTAYESSAASGPHIWLKIQSPANLNEPHGAMIEGIAHLRLENAVLVRNQLAQLIDNHYQVPKLYWSIEVDEDGDKHTVCPACDATGTIVEVDRAVRFNDLEFGDETVIARMGEEGDWEFSNWFCESCNTDDLLAPDDFKIDDWL